MFLRVEAAENGALKEAKLSNFFVVNRWHFALHFLSQTAEEVGHIGSFRNEFVERRQAIELVASDDILFAESVIKFAHSVGGDFEFLFRGNEVSMK